MKTITIYPPVEVFDDPEFCEDGEEETCKQIRGTLEHCSTFIDYRSGEPFPTKLEYNEKESKAIKCPQCKDLYAKTKAKVVIGRYINHGDGSIEFLGEDGFLEIANDLSLKRAEFCKKMGPCPECKTEQVQLLGWPENPYCKCRNCKHEWGKK